MIETKMAESQPYWMLSAPSQAFLW